MTTQSTLVSFAIEEPYEIALRMARIALSREGLRAPAELDIAARIRQESGADVAACMVLYVDDPLVLLESVVFDRAAPLLIPVPVVVTGDHRRARIVVRNPVGQAPVPESLREPLTALGRRMTRAIESIAERRDAELTDVPVAGV
jgi:hypothetical protein